MTGQDDVVVADGIGEEIGCLVLVGKSDDLLGATKVGLRLVLHEVAFGNEMAGEIGRYLEDSDGTFFHKAAYGNANTRLEMGVVFVTLHHIKGDGTVGEKHLTRFRVDARRIGLETRDTKQGTGNHHGEHSGHISLATSHIALGVQLCQRQAARIPD